MMKFMLDGSSVSISFKYKNAVTMCHLEIDDNMYGGYALCSSLDKFNKEKGRKIALRRALELAGVDKGHRRVIWIKYHTRGELPDDLAFILAYVPDAENYDYETALLLATSRSNQAAFELVIDLEEHLRGRNA